MVSGRKSFFYGATLLLAALLTVGSSGFNSKLPSASDMLVIEGEGPEWSPSKKVRAAVEVYVADYNGDHFGDIAALTPRYDFSSLSQIVPNAGAINVTYGNSTGITTNKNSLLLLEGQYLQPNSFLGVSGAAGDINRDGFTDLIGGAPGLQYGSNSLAGGIVYFKSSRMGFTTDKVLGGDRPNLFLGSSLTTGDYNGDGFIDVVSGAIGYKVNGKSNAGALYAFDGPNLDFRGRWTLASGGIKGIPKANDFFGSSLFSADINNDGYYDAIVGSGSGNGERGFANILYGGPNGLGSAGNQYVRLNNALAKDFFAFKVGACYCNNDDFADAIFTAPGLQNNKGAAFLIDGTKSGLSKTGSFFIQSPSAKEGDRFGYSISGIGTRGWYTFGFGSPDADYNGVQDSGRVDLFNLNALKWSPFAVGNGNLTGRRFGKSLQFTANLNIGTYFLSAGAPGSTVNGKIDAGLFINSRLKLGLNGSYQLTNRKTFHLDKLKGDNQDDGEFANEFASFSLERD